VLCAVHGTVCYHGRYHGSTAAAKSALPYDAGFESVGVVVAMAPPNSSSASSSTSGSRQQQQVAVGAAVATMDAGFSEYGVVPINRLLQVRGW
jgi:4-aminobutyrate aminotransferase-like enzyme